jgi:hypothetical protein
MYNLFLVATWVILLPAAVAAIKFANIPRTFKPLVYLLWVGTATELVAIISASVLHNNLYVYNVYMLIDFFMMVWLFFRWGGLRKMAKTMKYWVGSLYILLWVFDNCILNNLGQENIIFRMVYSISLVLLGIDQLSRIFVKNNGFLGRNPYLYICLAIIFYYTYSTFIPLLTNSSLFGPGPALWQYTMLIYVVVNVATNILYTISLLWMHKRAKSI